MTFGEQLWDMMQAEKLRLNRKLTEEDFVTAANELAHRMNIKRMRKKQAATKPKAERQRDPVFDVLAELD